MLEQYVVVAFNFTGTNSYKIKCMALEGKLKILNYSLIGLTSMVASLAVIAYSPNAHAAEQIGVSAAVRGNVELIQQGQTPRKASSGIPVYFEEQIISGADSGMQLMLLDKTTFTIGPDSEIVIDEMVYDPAGNNSSLSVSVAQGAFRYLSGEIGKHNPQNVTINTPSGSIGIRGTNLFATQTNGNWFFGLLGPGPGNNTGDKPGGFVFKNAQGEAKVSRPGYGFAVETGGAPGSVGPIPPEIYAKFSAAVSKQAKSDDENGDGAGDGDGKDDGTDSAKTTEQKTEQKTESLLASTEETSGQKQAVTQVAAITQQLTQDVQGDIAAISAIASQSDVGKNLVVPEGVYIPLTFDDVRVFSGSATYGTTNIPIVTGALPDVGNNQELTGDEISAAKDIYLSQIAASTPIIGSYDYSATVDFTARTISGSYYNIGASATGTTSIISNASLAFNHSYAGQTGAGILTYDVWKVGDGTNIGTGGLPTGTNLDAGMAFLKTNTTKPDLGQVLMITDSNWNDAAFGMYIHKAQ